MGEQQSTEVTLAVAVNDINWMKATMTDMSEGVKDLQTTVNTFIKNQDETAAKKTEVEKLEIRVRKLEGWRNWLTGAYVVGAGIVVVLFEYGKQWLGGGGH